MATILDYSKVLVFIYTPKIISLIYTRLTSFTKLHYALMYYSARTWARSRDLSTFISGLILSQYDILVGLSHRLNGSGITKVGMLLKS